MESILGKGTMIWRMIGASCGIWLMVAPHYIEMDRFCSNHDRIVGPLIALFAIMAITQATRPLRFGVLALGAWLLIAPFVLGYWDSEPLARNNDMIVAVICISVSLVRGKITEQFGGGWRVLWKNS